MSVEWFSTANSQTKIAYHKSWLVMDLGSGHNPHPRADVLVDRYLLNNADRSGQAAIFPPDKPIVVADAGALPFKDNVFDFVICSHLAEHIQDVDSFCSELNRVAQRGYIESPSKLAETLRHNPIHRWFVTIRHGVLCFNSTPDTYPLGWLGKLFFSVYFYRRPQVDGKDVFPFALGSRKPWHYILLLIRWGLVRLWLLLKPITYTRLLWKSGFSWVVERSRKNG